MTDLMNYLRERSYPGRGILLGRSADNKKAVIAYFIMGRSANSRNRIFEKTADGIRTRAYDESRMVDPSLIIYHPVRVLTSGDTVVTNGDQTDTIRDYMEAGKTSREALATRTFEPDGPNWTPRISGVVGKDGTYELSILKSLDGDESCSCRYFYNYDAPKAGSGHFISTYTGFGDPIPSFAGEPVRVAVEAESAAQLAEQIWNALNEDNKVSLFVRYIDLASGGNDTVIVNKYN